MMLRFLLCPLLLSAAFSWNSCRNKWELIEKRQYALPPDFFRGAVPDSFRHLLPFLDSVLVRDQKYRFLSLDKDPKIRNLANDYALQHKEELIALDRQNLKTVDSIIGRHGWLGLWDIGMRGSQALFIVIQHAPSEIQERYLPTMRKAVTAKKLPGGYYAMLVDRLQASKKRPQIFGSQILQSKDTAYVYPLANTDSIDSWRKRIGMSQSFPFYLQSFQINWDPRAYKRSLPALRKQFGIPDSIATLSAYPEDLLLPYPSRKSGTC